MEDYYKNIHKGCVCVVRSFDYSKRQFKLLYIFQFCIIFFEFLFVYMSKTSIKIGQKRFKRYTINDNIYETNPSIALWDKSFKWWICNETQLVYIKNRIVGIYYTSREAHKRELSGSTMKDRSDDPSLHERKLLPQSYISLPYIFKYTLNTYLL